MDDRFKGRSIRQSFDWKLVGIYLALVVIGWLNIYAAVHSSEPSSIFDFSLNCGKQFVWICTALVLAALILFVIPPRLWESTSVLLYCLVIVLLVAVIFLGVDIKGSRSWFAIGPVRFQPAEISKITTSLLLANILSKPNFRITRMKDFLLAAAVIAVPMLIIVAEKETGSALVYVGFIFMLYREGLSGWFLAAIGLAILTFILTLTASAYTSILVIIAIVSLVVYLDRGKFLRWLCTFGIYVFIMAMLPGWWAALLERLVPGASLIGQADPWVEQAILSSSKWAPLARVNLLYVLLATALPAIPFFLIRSYRERNSFMGMAVPTLIAGVLLVFSTEYIFNDILQDHQRNRIAVLLGLKEDPSGAGYNVNQSMIAIGSGGLTGKGYLHGTQTTYGFVPEQSTDFIFCTVGEEWGFVGCFVVILLYVLLIWGIIVDAEHSRQHFTRIYGYCLASCLFMHLFINIGMTIGLMPVIGIPLPLMSYGGSSLWTFTIMIFIFLVLDHEEKKYF